MKSKAGRKRLPKGEKRIPLRIFPMEKSVKAVGGIEKAKEITLKSIEK